MFKKVGITGGIGSGKTTVCRMFETLGIPIFYADIQAKRLMETSPYVKSQVVDLLGEKSYFPNGKPDRKFIAGLVFTDSTLLDSINKIIHPLVHAEADRWYDGLKTENNTPFCLYEAALLVENGSFKMQDALIVVTCPEEIRLERVMLRDKALRQEVQQKIDNQLPEEDKIRVADFIIKNDGTQPLIPQVWDIYNKLSS
jgi:dephospho-CoA kinase